MSIGNRRFFLLVSFISLILIGLSTCSIDSPYLETIRERINTELGIEETYTVTYDANGAESGDIPTDVNTYSRGMTVTVLGNPGGLTKSGETFSGWNTLADGTGQTYTQGATFEMGVADVVLYARWTTNPTYTVAYKGNGHTGGSVPVDTTNYEEGMTVTVLGNTGGLTKYGGSFSGWNRAADGSDTGYVAGNTFVMGAEDVELYAVWTPIWVNSYGSLAGNETPVAAVPTSDGGCIVAGNTDAGNGDGLDIYLFKVDEAGEYVWQYSYGGTEDEEVIGADLLPDGRIVVAANTVVSGHNEILVMCFNPDGTIDWQKYYGESDNDSAMGMDVSPTGDIYICGEAYNPNSTDMDRIICKLSSSGVDQWEEIIDARDGDEYYRRVNVLADGSFLLLGMGYVTQFSSAGTELGSSVRSLEDRYFEVTVGNDGYLSIYSQCGACYLEKQDLSGTSEWLTEFEVDGFENGITFRQYSDGSTISGGYSASTVNGDEDIFLLLIDSVGGIEDHVSLALADNQQLADFIITEDNNYILCGTTEVGTGTDILLIRTDDEFTYFNDQLVNLDRFEGPCDGGGGTTGYPDYTSEDYDYQPSLTDSPLSPAATSFLKTSIE